MRSGRRCQRHRVGKTSVAATARLMGGTPPAEAAAAVAAALTERDRDAGPARNLASEADARGAEPATAAPPAAGSGGCAHYQRHCLLLAPCCGQYYSCRFCHDDASDHTLQRASVVQLKCAVCSHEQPVATGCSKCGTVFGRYACLKCRLFDDDTSKLQFHCDGCGLCRCVGQRRQCRAARSL